MWSADGEECQFSFIDVVCKLIYCRPTNEESIEYIKSIFMMLVDKWPGIDQHRVDKFYKFIRNFLYETFVFLHKTEWKSELVNSFIDILDQIFNNVEEGVKNHILDIFYEELNVADKSISGDILLQFFTFFLDHFINENKFEVKRYVDDIFKCLINNYELVSDSSKKDKKKNKKSKKSKKQKKGEEDDENNEEVKEEEDKKIFYNCDIREYLQLLFTYASIKKMTNKKRKVMYEVYNDYKNKAIELFPKSGIPDVVIPEETAENLEEIEKDDEIRESNIEEEESLDDKEEVIEEKEEEEEGEEEEGDDDEEEDEENPKKRKRVSFNDVIALDENNEPYSKKPKFRYPNIKKQKAKMVAMKMPKRRVGKKRRKV